MFPLRSPKSSMGKVGRSRVRRGRQYLRDRDRLGQHFEDRTKFKLANGVEVIALVHDSRLLWPDTMSLSDDGYLM